MDGLKATLSFDAFAYDYDDEYLTIDTDTHTINVNNVSRLFGVQYDGNSKLIKFRIRNKLSDIQKMQDSIVYINWIDSKGVKGQSIAINKTINDDTCEFAWKVPFDALKNSGVLHFAMSAVVTKDGSNVIDQRWSTQIASVITPDGIYIKSYTPSSEEEDKIAQIYNELSKMINKQSDNLQAQVNLLKEGIDNNNDLTYINLWELGEYDHNGGVELDRDIAIRSVDFVEMQYNSTIYASGNAEIRVLEYDMNKEWIRSPSGIDYVQKYTVENDDVKYIKVNARKKNQTRLTEDDIIALKNSIYVNSVKNVYTGFGYKKTNDNRLYITPQDFGAKGDGITDDTVAFQKCVTFALLKEVPILIPSGKYYITDSIYFGKDTPKDWLPAIKISGTITRSNDSVRSNGAEIICGTNKPVFMLNLQDDNSLFKSNSILGFDISNLKFVGKDGYSSVAIRLGGFCRAKFHDISGINLKALIDEPEKVTINGVETVNYPDAIELRSIHLEDPLGTQLVIRHADIGIVERVVFGGDVNSKINSLIIIDSCSAISIRDIMIGISSSYDNVSNEASYMEIISSTGTIENFRVEKPAFKYIYDFNSSSFVVTNEVIWYNAYNTIVYHIYNSDIRLLSSERRGVFGDFSIIGEEISKINIDKMFKSNNETAPYELRNDKMNVLFHGHKGLFYDCYKYVVLRYITELGHLIFTDDIGNDLTYQYGYPTVSNDKSYLVINNTPEGTHNILAFCNHIFESRCKYTIKKEIFGEVNDKVRYRVYYGSEEVIGDSLANALPELEIVMLHS